MSLLLLLGRPTTLVRLADKAFSLLFLSRSSGSALLESLPDLVQSMDTSRILKSLVSLDEVHLHLHVILLSFVVLRDENVKVLFEFFDVSELLLSLSNSSVLSESKNDDNTSQENTGDNENDVALIWWARTFSLQE